MRHTYLLPFALLLSAAPEPCAAQHPEQQLPGPADSLVVVVHAHPALRQDVVNEVKLILSGTDVSISDIVHLRRRINPTDMVNRSMLLREIRSDREGTGIAAIDSTASVLAVSLSADMTGDRYSQYGAEVTWQTSASLVLLGASELPITRKIEGNSQGTFWRADALQGLQDALAAVVNVRVAHR